ncbi:MAG TPA: hypothetical protein VG326_00910 [Tepidisphaeraceae bacterium]|jgi:hypothetical protein|nr:hypothetical protein [Tepidisphaeraceae bacterium]
MNYPSASRRLAIVISAAFFGLATGCVEPNYRTDVRPTGQGGVEVYRLPKDDPTPGPAPVSNIPAASQAPQNFDQQIDALEKQVRAKNAEIERLKQEKASHPTTAQ